MNCPVCNRDNTFNLSVCPSCGAMSGDSVREALILKVTPLVRPLTKPIPKPENIDLRGNSPVQNTPNPKFLVKQPGIELGSKTEIKAEIPKEDHETSELDTKHTSPTLVEFHNKNAKLPEWRLQLKNAVRQRNNKVQGISDGDAMPKNMEIADSPNLRRRKPQTSGANALKVEEVAEALIENVSNPKLAAALKRIEKSRKQFLEDEKPAAQSPATNPAKRNNSVLYFTAKPNDHLPKTSI